VEQFVAVGRQAAHELEAALRSVGRSLSDVRSVLDLGCGSARVLPHVAALAPDASLAGCDIDTAAIAWAARNYPQHDWSVSHFRPPLPYPEERFDLVYSISVFSHLDESDQDRWLEELGRVLRPGGVALLSVHGAHAFEQFRSGRVTTTWCRPGAFDRPPLEPWEFVFEPYVRSVFTSVDLPGVSGQYGLAFHGGEYLRERWSRWLSVQAGLERSLTEWQYVVVCGRG
jgi:SAM-dependent methyltransferase